MEEELLTRLRKLGVLSETAALDDVLDLTKEDLLERRLQTIVLRKGLSKTIHQARQLITHGHIAIGIRRVRVPSYIVTTEEEKQIAYVGRSPLANQTHPLRQLISVAPATEGTPSEPVRGEGQ
jgi:small subunit ribosomal protein S4